MNKFAIGFLGIFLIYIFIDIVKKNINYAGSKALQLSASMQVANYIKSSQAYIKEFKKLPVTAKDLAEYIVITGCVRDDPDFCRKEPPINHSSDEIKTWFGPTGNYQFEIENSEKTFYITAKPTGKNKEKLYGVIGYSSSEGNTKVFDLNYAGDDFTIENYLYKNPYRESQNREEKFLLCYENAQSEKDINLRTKKENKCQRERFSNYPKLRDSFKD